jgi:hypothetical protein
MQSLKKKSIEYIRKNVKNLLRDAYDGVNEIPLDQIEDSLFEEVARQLNNDFKGVVRLIQIEKELMIRNGLDEDDQAEKVISFCQKMLFKMIEISIDEIQTLKSEPKKAGRQRGQGESYNPF